MAPTDTIYVVLNDDDGEPIVDSEGKPIMIKGMDHANIKGITFLRKEEDGTKNRIQVMDAIEDRRKGNEDFTKFTIKYDRDQVEDIMSYNDIMNHIHRDRLEDGGNIWKFRNILGHQGPLNHRNPDYKNSLYNLEIEWENGEITFEPLNLMIADDELSLIHI